MTTIIIDSEADDLQAALHALGLSGIATVGHFRELVSAMQEAERESVRSRILTSGGHGCVAGQHVRVGGDVYVIAGAPSRFEMDLERMVRASMPERPRRPGYGNDRPYLKKKKGRS